MIRRTLQDVSRVFLLITAIWAGAPIVHAQQPAYPYSVDTKPSRGIMPNSEQIVGALDSIDPISRKLHISIPLASLPDGNAGSGFDLALNYDSNQFDLVAGEAGDNKVTQYLSTILTGGGWHYSFQNYRVEQEQRYIPSWEQPYCDGDPQYVMEHNRTYRYRISLPDGSQHVLHLSGYGDEVGDGYYGDGFYAVNMSGVRSNCAHGDTRYPANATGLLTYYTTDGSYLRFQIYADGTSWWTRQWTLFYPDGRRVVGRFDQAEHIYDANGNGVHVTRQNENGRTVAYISDDYGRSMRLEYSFTSSSTEKEDRITVEGPNGPLEWRVKWQRIQIGGPSSTYVCWEDPLDFTIHWNCGMNYQVWAVKYIQLPPSAPYFQPPPAAPWTSFEFAYTPAGQGYGRLIWMRAPTGVEYSYCCDSYAPDFLAEGIAYAGYRSRSVTHDGVTDVWSYEHTGLNSALVTNPDGGQITYRFHYSFLGSELWSRNLVYQTEEPGGVVRKRQWARNRAFGLRAAINVDSNNPYTERESVTVDSVPGQPRTTITDYVIDKNGNVLQSIDYGWSTTVEGPSMENAGPLLRATETAYHLPVPAAADTGNGNDRYWHPAAPHRLNAVARRVLRDEAWSVRAITELFYDDPFSKGNVTYQRFWDDTKPGCVASVPLSSSCPLLRRDYDDFGNLTDVYDPEIRTHVTYSGPYPSLVEYAPGTGSYRSFAYNWNFTAGVLTAQTDLQNGTVTSYGYDAFGRRVFVEEAGQRQTQTFHDDENRAVLVKQDLRNRGDGLLQTRTHRDQLGRVHLVQTSDGAPLGSSMSDGIKVKTAYRTIPNGTATVTSTPFRWLSDTTLEWTCSQKDQAGRIVATAMFKGAAEPADCQSPANRTGIAVTDYHSGSGVRRVRVIDPAGKMSDRYVDALGRLSLVVEDPLGAGYSTAYAYDVTGNLMSVVQSDSGVTQQRSFTYSSLGRLMSATNPESGTLRFAYNDSGDLLTRQDDRGYVTTLNYDALRRVVAKTYWNDGDLTPDVTYSYHATAPCAGQLKSVASAAGSTSFNSCDSWGRVLHQTQTIAGAGTFELQYTYWLDGSPKTMQYPSGKVIYSDVDDAGRDTRVYSQSKIFADISNVSLPYVADGRLARLRLGNNLWETREYQPAGSPTTLRLGTSDGAADKLELQYNFSGSGNNGNVLSQVIRRGGYAWSQTYEYDALNRLTCATERMGPNPAPSCSWEDSWRQTFGFDRFGNRWVASSTGFAFSDVHEFTAESMIDKWTNRVIGSSYDAAGNQTWYAPWTLRYDAENRVIDSTSIGNGSSWFSYDGDGRRIKKVTANPSLQTTFYVYDAAGRLAAEYSSQPLPSGTAYLFPDLLGTPRAITSDDGSIIECSDYSPYGRLLQTPSRNLPCHQNAGAVPQQFTGHVRDQETKLDFFGARYFSAAQGRFLSTDGLLSKKDWLVQPQRWNRYAYALNNPTNFLDPDGKDAIAAFFLGEQYRHVSTLDVIFSKETITDLGRAWNLFLADHKGLTKGLSPFPTSLEELTTQLLDPFGGKFLTGPLMSKVLRVGGKSSRAIEETAEHIGAATPNGTVFWSGRQGANRAAAEAFAQASGKSTLEMTKAGKALEAAGGNIAQWKDLSAEFARNASGEVHAFVGGSRVDSIWNTVEKPILMQNPNVQKIIIHDATQPWKTRIIFK
jgi:RHS repeat-associated protein